MQVEPTEMQLLLSDAIAFGLDTKAASKLTVATVFKRYEVRDNGI